MFSVSKQNKMITFGLYDTTKRMLRKVLFRCGTFAIVALFVTIAVIVLPYQDERTEVFATVEPMVVPSTLSFNSINDTASLIIDPSPTGTFASTSGNDDIQFSVLTNNYTGYTITISADKTTMDNGGNSLLSIGSDLTAEQFANAQNTALNNRWGYKPNYFDSEENTKYLTSPTSEPVTLDSTSSANELAKEYTISLGARADISIPNGNYVNSTLLVQYVANAVPYQIIFNGNGGEDAVSNLPNIASGSAVTAATVTLPSTVPTRPNHVFAGWCTVQPVKSTGGNETCSGVLYQPEDDYAIDYTDDNTGKVLYAVWDLNITCNGSATTINTGVATDAVCLQDMNNTIIGTMTTGTSYRLIDVRDGTYYHIAKLNDGNVWMAENLDLGRVGLTSNLTYQNTNLSTTVAASAFNGWKKITASASNSAGELISVDGTDATSESPYGTLYNYYVATAGTVSGDSNEYSAEFDICPRGWRLPSGGSEGELDGLYDEYNSNASMRNSVSDGGAGFALAGRFSSGAPTLSGEDGYYWSSTRSDNATMYGLEISTSSVQSVGTINRNMGSSIRCIFDNRSLLTINYNGNGLSFSNNADDTNNTVKYNVSSVPGMVTKYSHTSNIDDTGTADGDHDVSLNTNHVVTIPGASSIHVTLTYQTEGTSYDWVSMWAGSHPEYSAADDYALGIVVQATGSSNGKYGGEALTTIETDIVGDSVTFGFVSDEDYCEYGYYAVVTGQGTVIDKTTVAGTYKTLVLPTGTYLTGWSENSDGTGTVYKNHNDIVANYDVTNGEEKTLYAIHDDKYKISISSYSDAISGITVSDDGTTICEVGMYSSAVCMLSYGKAYTLEAAISNGYTFDSWENNENAGVIAANTLSTTYTPTNKQDEITVNATPNYYDLTIVYDAGISQVTVNDVVVANGGSVSVQYARDIDVVATLNGRYIFDGWTAVGGELWGANQLATVYYIGTADDTLTASTTYVDKAIQNLSQNDCTSMVSKVYDNRDDKIYTIQRLADGNCWMMDNLDLGRTDLSIDLTSTNTNIATTITAATFNGWRTDPLGKTYDDGVLLPIDGTDSTAKVAYGTLYNYYAATAGTIAGEYNNDSNTYDICPAGWRLPTGGNSGELRNLYNNESYNTASKMRKSVTNGGAAFALAGYFDNDTHYNKTYNGYYWSSVGGYLQDGGVMSISSSTVSPASRLTRNKGASIRCILNNATMRRLDVAYGNGISSISIGGVTLHNGDSVMLEQGRTYSARVALDTRYAFDAWVATAGEVGVDGPSSTYIIGDSNATLTASAVYVNKEIQNLYAGDCTTTPLNVYDNRDDQVYVVQRLNDNNCWMMDNLNLGAVAIATDLTRNNTNLNTTVSASTFNGWKVSESAMTYTDGEYIALAGSSSVTGTRYGTLYNYYAASAGTVSGSSSSSGADYDICPAGWKLPTDGNATADYKTLFNTYNSNATLLAPISDGGLAFVKSGEFANGSSKPSNVDSRAYYWSASYSSATMMYRPDPSASLGSYYTADRRRGAAVRCVMKPHYKLTVSYGEGVSSVKIDGNVVNDGDTIYLATSSFHDAVVEMSVGSRRAFSSWSMTNGSVNSNYVNSRYTTISSTNKNDSILTANTTYVNTEIQNLSTSSCTSTPSYAYDNRDGQVYMIARLSDGRCWMIDNLNLGAIDLNTDLTSTNTNLSNTVSASTFNGWRVTTGSQTYDDGEFISVPGIDVSKGSYEYSAASNYGTLYNYYVASAGTIAGSTNSNDVLYDICPAGWRMPSNNSIYGEYAQVLNLYFNNGTNPRLNYPVYNNGAGYSRPGHFANGEVTGTDVDAHYWSTTKINGEDANRNTFGFSSLNVVNSVYSGNRADGYSMRCILKESHELTVSYGTGVSGVTIDGNTVPDGEKLTMMAGEPHIIDVTLDARYGFDSWSATSGVIAYSDRHETIYTISGEDATLTVNGTITNTAMQNLDPNDCTTTASLVYDTRDSQVYTIKRLNDGMCWMLKNLNLGATALTTDLTSSNTNLSATITAATFNGWKKTTGSNTLNDGEYISVSGTFSNNGSDYGTLYNYFAASAGTIAGGSSDAEYDICPAGWRLPTGGNTSEYGTLLDLYSYKMSSMISAGGLAFSEAGYFTNSSVVSTGSYGYYYSQNGYGSNNAYVFDMFSIPQTTYYHANNTINRAQGASVRCVLKEQQ